MLKQMGTLGFTLQLAQGTAISQQLNHIAGLLAKVQSVGSFIGGRTSAATQYRQVAERAWERTRRVGDRADWWTRAAKTFHIESQNLTRQMQGMSVNDPDWARLARLKRVAVRAETKALNESAQLTTLHNAMLRRAGLLSQGAARASTLATAGAIGGAALGGTMLGGAIGIGAVRYVTQTFAAFREAAPVLQRTEGSVRNIAALWKDAQKVFQNTTLTMEDSVQVVATYNRTIAKGRGDLLGFAQNVEAMSRVYGTSAAQMADAIRKAKDLGDISQYQQITGMSWGAMRGAARLQGRNVPENMGAGGRAALVGMTNDLLSSTEKDLAKKDLGAAFSKGWRGLKGAVSTNVNAAWLGFTTAQDLGRMNPQQRQDYFKKQEADELVKAKTVELQRVQELVVAIRAARAETRQYAQQWQEATNQSIAMKWAVKEIRATAERTRVGGSPFASALNAMWQGREGDQFLQQGEKFNPQMAQQYYSQAAGGAASMADRMKQISERLTGKTWFGAQTSNYAKGEEAWLLQREFQATRQQTMDKYKGAYDTAVAAGEWGKSPEAKLYQGAKEATTPEQLAKALSAFQEAQADKAQQASERFESTLKPTLEAATAGFKAATDVVKAETDAVSRIVEDLRKSPMQVKALLEADPEFHAAVAAVNAELAKTAQDTNAAVEEQVNLLRDFKKELEGLQVTEVTGKKGAKNVVETYKQGAIALGDLGGMGVFGNSGVVLSMLGQLVAAAFRTADNTAGRPSDGVTP